MPFGEKKNLVNALNFCYDNYGLNGLNLLLRFLLIDPRKAMLNLTFNGNFSNHILLLTKWVSQTGVDFSI